MLIRYISCTSAKARFTAFICWVLLNSSILSLRRSGRIILSVVEAVVHHVYQHESLIELNYAVSEGGAFFQFSECNFIASIHEEHCSACSITYNWFLSWDSLRIVCFVCPKTSLSRVIFDRFLLSPPGCIMSLLCRSASWLICIWRLHADSTRCLGRKFCPQLRCRIILAARHVH